MYREDICLNFFFDFWLKNFRVSKNNFWHGQQKIISLVQRIYRKRNFSKGMFFVFGNFEFDREIFKSFEGFFGRFDGFALSVARNTFWGRSVFQKKDTRKVSDIRQINSAPFLVCNFCVSVPLSWDKQRFQKTPPSLNLLRRVETLGVLAFLFRQVCQNTIPRVSTRDLRWDFVLAEVFCSDSLSDFEQNVSGNCLKTSQHACQSCFLLVWNYILKK